MDTIRVPCKKLYRAGDARVIPVECAVLHWTGSPPRAPGDANEARMRAWLADDGRQTSTHFVILRDGRVLQAAELPERTWHAGGSTWVDPTGRARRGVNAMSIGIDLENVGILRRAPDGSGGFVDGYGGAYKGAAPVKIGDVWCEPYTAAQAEQVVVLAAQLATQVRALRDGRRWVGHCDIQIGKADPGPAMPWAALRAAVEAVP